MAPPTDSIKQINIHWQSKKKWTPDDSEEEDLFSIEEYWDKRSEDEGLAAAARAVLYRKLHTTIVILCRLVNCVSEGDHWTPDDDNLLLLRILSVRL